MRKISGAIATVVGSAAMLAGLTAPTASAAGVEHCSEILPITTSAVCINDDGGYRAHVSVAVDLHGHIGDFNLECDNGQKFGDLGPFKMDGSDYSYIFTVGRQGRCHVTLYVRDAGFSISSPSITR
ncbi:hypothetical protein AB0N51_40600 [Streptomyces sp. NPDC052507]